MKNIIKNRKNSPCLAAGRRGGFTLVEILVVMGIIAMMSTLAVNGYISYRRTALLDLGADNLISQINRMKSKATYGSNGSAKFEEIKGRLEAVEGDGAAVVPSEGATSPDDENGRKCYGVIFESVAGESLSGQEIFEVKSFSVNFENKKVWEEGAWVYQGCENLLATSSKLDLEIDSQMEIFGLSGKTDFNADTDYSLTPSSALVLRFLPPDGKWEVGEMNVDGKFDSKPLESLKTLNFSLRYGSDSDLKYQRKIEFNLTNMKATKF